MISALGLNHSQLIELLKNNVVRVVFTKVDGTERVMECTLQESYLPDTQSGAVLTEGDGDQERVHVWDVQNGGWRSFYLNSLKGIAVAGQMNRALY